MSDDGMDASIAGDGVQTDGGKDSEIERVMVDRYPALISYVTAGDPSLEATKAYVEALDRGGSDLIELGFPFSEPIAEGPTIQAAINRSLDAGTTPDGFFDLVDDLETTAPLLVMTYYNVILQYGSGRTQGSGSETTSETVSETTPETVSGAGTEDDQPSRAKPSVRPFVERAAETGLSGIIVPDLPANEAGPLRSACDEFGLDLVFIVAPTTTGERLDRIMEQVSGFAYVQARLGTTGARTNVSTATHESLERLAAYDVPKAVGFGVSEGEHAAEIVEAGADGVIVGSALVDIIGTSETSEAAVSALESKARELKAGAVRGAERISDSDAPEPEQP